MNKKYVSAMLAALISTLAGCSDFTSPLGVVGTAYDALKRNDTKLFTETLQGRALARYGNLSGMSELQVRTAGKDVKFGKTTELGSRPSNGGFDETVVSEVEVLANGSVLLVATVECGIRHAQAMLLGTQTDEGTLEAVEREPVIHAYRLCKIIDIR